MMELSIMERLRMPFPVNQVSLRIGSTNKKKRVYETNDKNAKPTKGLPLAYIDARDVENRLDEVFGVEGWQTKYFETVKGRIICELSCLINGVWVTKSDGAGDTGTEGEKGAISDAKKRAAVQFGIGRYLYAIKLNWVDLDQYGKFDKPPLPDWAHPEKYTEILIKRKEKENEQS